MSVDRGASAAGGPGQGGGSTGPVEAVLIAGPTASGKSALALRLARKTGGILINADSMQNYRDLRVLTARPSAAEEEAAPHRLFGHVDGAVNYSVGLWLADARAALAEARAGCRLPIVVGGTGLAFRALTEGLSDLPAVPDGVRAAVRAEAEGRPTTVLHADLARADPGAAAGLRPTDRLRVLRALELHRASGRPLAELRGAPVPGPLAEARLACVFLDPERAALRETIDRRFAAMLEAGGLDEARALAARGLDPALPVMRAHGVPGLLALLRGETTLADALRRGQADTRAYAKRQVTWFRHQMPGFRAVDPSGADEVVESLLRGSEMRVTIA